MGQNSKIEWTDHTFNPWEGCAKVSPGCANCYAEARNHRFGLDNWGKGKPRRRTSEANWKLPLRWNRAATASRRCITCGHSHEACWRTHEEFIGCPACKTNTMARVRPRVFCVSIGDWLDDEVPIEWLADLLKLIHDTPNLDWLLLTKRPENWRNRVCDAMVWWDKDCPRMTRDQEAEVLAAIVMGTKVPDYVNQFRQSLWIGEWLGGKPPKNCWIGTTVENQEWWEKRRRHIILIPARVKFLSVEPMLGPIDFGNPYNLSENIHWVICGGESGPGTRPMHPDWARSLRDQCQMSKVPFFFKQWGEWKPSSLLECARHGNYYKLDTNNFAIRVGKKAAGRLLDGREWNEFPEKQ